MREVIAWGLAGLVVLLLLPIMFNVGRSIARKMGQYWNHKENQKHADAEICHDHTDATKPEDHD